MRTQIAAAVLLAVLSACATTVSARAAAPAANAVSSGGQDLQALALEAARVEPLDACYSGPLLAVIDDAFAGARLDALLAKLEVSAASRDQVCAWDVAVSRMVRLRRLKAYDLDAELRHSSWLVRAVVARAVALRPTPGAAPRVRALLADPKAEVRAEVHQAIVAGNDREAIPALRAMVEATRPPESDVWPRSTLCKLGEKAFCEETGGGLGLMGSGLGFKDYCAEAQGNVRAAAVPAQLQGLRFFVREAMEPYRRPFDRLVRGSSPKNLCELDAGVRDALVASSPAPAVRGVAAVVALWKQQPPLGDLNAPW